MGDNDSQRAREWLERQLAELAELRNATRRDPKFKQWRQQTVTVIQRIWPGELRPVDRFRRIPFSPPMPHPTDREVREHYERGWGEAGVLLRQLLAQVAAGKVAAVDDETLQAPPPLPELGADEPVAGRAGTAPEAAPGVTPAGPASGGDDIGRAMDRLLKHSPVFRANAPAPASPNAQAAPGPQAEAIAGPKAPAPASPNAPEAASPKTPAASPTAAGPRRPVETKPALRLPSTPGELVQVAGELESLGLPREQVADARRALVALDRATRGGTPDWDLVSGALAYAGASPTLARRLLPLLLPMIDRAA